MSMGKEFFRSSFFAKSIDSLQYRILTKQLGLDLQDIQQFSTETMNVVLFQYERVKEIETQLRASNTLKKRRSVMHESNMTRLIGLIDGLSMLEPIVAFAFTVVYFKESIPTVPIISTLIIMLTLSLDCYLTIAASEAEQDYAQYRKNLRDKLIIEKGKLAAAIATVFKNDGFEHKKISNKAAKGASRLFHYELKRRYRVAQEELINIEEAVQRLQAQLAQETEETNFNEQIAVARAVASEEINTIYSHRN